ncbi:chymotrypsin-like elastase family member 2A [Copidosoma floridanum]|uniref:chymotrypsin-like elastase family member 2A n=1 Tax=Copidosoma floridanum TaxID=29053 RepID=UPI0006C97957|nr:chymotrypsin-like elastase family member 2A [Copidosoma floridanum]
MFLLKILAVLLVIQVTKSEEWNGTRREEFPFVVNILKSDAQQSRIYLCNGALIKENYVITSASCVPEKDGKYVIRIGRKEIYVSKTIIHENYVNDFFVKDNDIAILQLEEKIELNELINIVKLPSSKETINKDIKSILVRSTDDGTIYEPLQSIVANITENTFCQLYLKKMNAILPGSQFCISPGIEYGSGPFYESGLPLVQKDDSGETVLIGIITDKHNVFTQVFLYIDWINGTINDDADTKY